MIIKVYIVSFTNAMSRERSEERGTEICDNTAIDCESGRYPCLIKKEATLTFMPYFDGCVWTLLGKITWNKDVIK